MRPLLLAAMALAAAIASAQSGSSCSDAKAAALDKRNQGLAENRKKRIDASTEYKNERERCRADLGCIRAAQEKLQQKTIELNADQREISATYTKDLIDIGQNICSTVGRQTRSSAPADSKAPAGDDVLSTADRSRLFKLSAEMDDIAAGEPGDSGNPAVEFFKGVADWAGDTLKFLAQKPGVPLQQTTEGFLKYLTNDNAANHQALRAAAEQAFRDFQKNPARFLGQQAPNLVPLPKAGALKQLADVEKAASRIQAVAKEERAFAGFYGNALKENKKWGASAGAACYGQNACVPTAIAEAELFKTGGPLGNGTPTAIRVHAPDPLKPDMALTGAQVSERLRGYGDGFTPRRSGTYNPEQLDQIWQGNPIATTQEGIEKIITREGIGSQGIVFVEYHPTLKNQMNHAFNVQNNGGVQWVDKTLPAGMDPLATSALVKQWWFFPIQY